MAMIEKRTRRHALCVPGNRTVRSRLLTVLAFSTIAAAPSAAVVPALAVGVGDLNNQVHGDSQHATVAVASRHAAAAPSPEARAAAGYNQAQRDFHSDEVPAGLAELNQALALTPNNSDMLALRALWTSQQLDYAGCADSLARLGAIDPGKRAGAAEAIRAVSSAAVMTPDPFPSRQGPRTAIVVLGYGLLPDGSMRPELVDRLATAWLEAIVSPESPIITTGGNPRNGVAEGQVMADWLIAHGIPAGRVFPETRADSTVQNALYSARIIHAVGATSAIVVTSADHIRRAVADMAIAGVPVVGQVATTNRLMAQLLPLSPAQQWSMYVDATDEFGLPATIRAPAPGEPRRTP